jgi:hypothetical protein
MRIRSTLLLGAFASLGFVAGCGDDGDSASGTEVTLQVTALSDRWLLRSPTTDDLLWVTREGASASVEPVELGARLGATVSLPDGGLVALDAAERRLFLVDGEGAQREVALPTIYDAVAVSDDGRFVVASFSPSSSGPPDSILFNPNSIAVIDTTAAAPEAREILLSGPRPQWIRFSGDLTFADPSRAHRFAIVGGQSAVSLVDLTTTEPADLQRLIRLTDPASGATLFPAQVHVTADDPADPNDVFLFILASGSRELFAVNLLPAEPASGRTLQPAINQIAVAGYPARMLPYSVAGAEKLLVVSGSTTNVSIIDVATGSASFADTGRSITSAYVYELVEDGAVRPEALLYTGGSNVVLFADLATIERQGSGALRARPLGGGVSEIVPVPSGSRQRVIARYSGGLGLSVVDLALRTETPIPSRLALGAFALVGDRFFAVVPESARLAILTLGESVSAQEVELPGPGAALSALPASNALLVVHPGSAGWFSVIGLDTLSEGPLAEFQGVLLDGWLDRAESGEEGDE